MAIGCKRTRNRFLIEHFAHDTHDEKHDDAGNGITDEDRRPCHLNRIGRAHEQADTNRPAKGDHFNVTGL